MIEEEEEIDVPIKTDLERRIADAFEVFDPTMSKVVDVREVSTIIRGLGLCPTEAEVQEIILAVENPKSPGTVHLGHFLPYVFQIITEHKYEPASAKDLFEAFQLLDTKDIGYLTKEEIITAMTQDGEPLTQDELEEMLDLAIDPLTNTLPYEYYMNQLVRFNLWSRLTASCSTEDIGWSTEGKHEPQGEDSVYRIADRIEAEKAAAIAAELAKRKYGFF